MKCKHCGQALPETSTFGPYCGASVEAAPQEEKKNKAKKEKKCGQCGALLGKKAKVCPICGTLIPRKTLNPKPVLIAMSIAICLLLCGTSYFMLEMFQGNAAITRLEGENEKLSSDVAHYSKEAEKNKSEADYWKKESSKWQKDSFYWEDQYQSIEAKAQFMDDYIVFIGNSNRNYHSFDCHRLDLSYFYAYNTENARAQGYRACPVCQ